MKRIVMILFVVMYFANISYSQEREKGQESLPPSPVPVEGEGRTEEAPVTAVTGGEGKTQGVAAPEKREGAEKGEAREGAPEAASQVTPVEGKMPPRWTVEITPKVQAVDLDRDSSKAREYRALPEGLYIDTLIFDYQAGVQEFSSRLKRGYLMTHLIDDGYGGLSYRRYGLLDIDLSIERYPRVYSTAPPIDLSNQRDTYNLGFRFTPGDRLSVSTSISVEERKGKRPLTVESFTGLTGSPTAIIEIPDPVDYTTTTIDLGLEYLDDLLDIEAKNMLQIFSNNLKEEVTWDNPYGGSEGKARTAGDYTVHTLSIKPAIKLGSSTKLSNTLSYSKVTSSIDLVPFTTVPGVGEPFLRDLLDTDMRSLVFSSLLSLQPHSDVRLNVKYRSYSLRNGTPQIEEPPPYVMIDGDAGAIRYTRIPHYMAYTARSIGLDGAWFLTNRFSLETDLEKKETIREEREVDREDQERISFGIRLIPFDNLSGRISYTRIGRHGGYNPAYYHTIYDPDPANDVIQHPLMRAFDLSRLVSNGFTLNVDYSPLDVLSLGSTWTLTDGRHPSVDIGERRSFSESLSLYAQYRPFADLLFYYEYYYDSRKIDGSYTWTFNSDLSYPQDPAYPGFTNPFKGTIEDIGNNYSIGFDYSIDRGLSISGRYGLSDSKGKGIDLPDVDSRTEIFEIDASYRLRQMRFSSIPVKEVKINAGYYWEDYRRNDYSLDNFPATVVDPNIDADVFLGIRESDYRLSIYSLSISFWF